MIPPNFTETNLNTGAESQEQPVDDVQVTEPAREQLESQVSQENRGQRSDEHERTIGDTEPSAVPLAPSRPDVPGSERVIRCSSRSNKGRTEKYGDFVTGQDIDKL